jgi:hypothetical protein
MGLTAGAILLGTRARVGLLVVLYAINVFVTFTLSQLGMSVHWWKERKRVPRWIRKLAVNGIGCLFTALILVVTVTLKFDEGGWVTIAMTGGVVTACYLVRRHYARVARAIDRLEVEILPQLFNAAAKEPSPRDPHAPTAALLVNGFNGLGLATLTTLSRLFDNQFKNVVFISVGEVDSALLKSPAEVQQLESKVADDLIEYCRLAADLGFYAELRTGIGTDVVLELKRLCFEVASQFGHTVFFAGQLVFGEEINGFVSRFLHNQTALEVLQWLQLHGLSLVILPVRVSAGQSPQTRETAPKTIAA